MGICSTGHIYPCPCPCRWGGGGGWAASWEDEALHRIISRYERKGYVIPEDRKELFKPQEYK